MAHLPPFNVALIPDPIRRSELERAVRDRRAALGPQVPWQEATVSFARAREVLRLAGEGGIDGDEGLLMAESHKLSLLLGADRRLARDVAESALSPLDGETELSRERLGSTLDAWLRHRGRTEAVAKALHVHPQTVRYRLAKLRELFGDAAGRPRRPLRAGAGASRPANRRVGCAPMPGPLDGRVAVVTGASSGIGEATVRGLSEAGASIALGARRTDRLQAAGGHTRRPHARQRGRRLRRGAGAGVRPGGARRARRPPHPRQQRRRDAARAGGRRRHRGVAHDDRRQPARAPLLHARGPAADRLEPGEGTS